MPLLYDAIIIGAGPAGGQCARELAEKGWHVLIVDKAKNFWENNYSSGGAPLEVMENFSLPPSIVGSYWNTFTITSAKEKTVWSSPDSLGTILDFDKLREFLTSETVRLGGEFRSGCSYISHQVYRKETEVVLKDLESQKTFSARGKILIDATGSERRVLSKNNYNKKQAMTVTGIESHIKVPSSVYNTFSNSLHFFLGPKWMPQGYGWIFPMGANQLKVGVIRYFQNKKYVSYEPSYRHYLNQLLDLCHHTDSSDIIDTHGKTIHYTLGQKDKRQGESVLAIGDAISAINPLGCEGIRHALASGRLAAEETDQFLEGNVQALGTYHKKMTAYFGTKWFFSEWMMHRLFKIRRDSWMDVTISHFGLMTTEQLIDVIFYYRYSHIAKSCFLHYMQKAKEKIWRN